MPLRTTPSASLRGVADRAVVDRHFRQPLAAREREIADDEVALDGRRKRRRLRRCVTASEQRRGGEAHAHDSAVDGHGDCGLTA